jgi:ubiquinone/menaquinone biosynthesis C-methylase UbiE
MFNYLLSKVWFYNLIQFLLARKSHQDIQRFLEEAGLLSGQKLILDVGCGPGDQSKYFKKNYIGIDISPNYISNAKKKYLA